MRSIQKSTAALAGLLALPLAALVAAPAQAAAPAATGATASAQGGVEVHRRGRCGPGRYELSVERDGRGYDVSVELDRVGAGTRWRIVLRHNGTRFARITRRADREGEIDVDRFASNRAGRESFGFTARRVGGGPQCRNSVYVP